MDAGPQQPPGEPGQPPAPGAPMDPLEAQMLLEEELLLLMNEPIIPDPLVYCCGCMYLVLVMGMMGGLSVFLYTRLTPPALATAAAETESEVKYTEATVANVTRKRLWDKASPSHPLMCLVDLATTSKSDLTAFSKLCIMVVIKNPLFFTKAPKTRVLLPSNAALLPRVKDAANSAVNPVIAIVVDRNLPFFQRPVVDRQLPNITGFYYEYVDQKSRFLASNMKALKTTYALLNKIHVVQMDSSALSSLSRVLSDSSYVVVAFTTLHADQAQPPVARLPNPWQPYGGLQQDEVLLTGLSTAAQNLTSQLASGSLCIALTAATFSADPTPGRAIAKPGDPAAKVTLAPYSQVCKVHGAQKDPDALSKYALSQGGAQSFVGFDDPESFKEKVTSLLTAQPTLCLFIYDAHYDDATTTCDQDVLPLTRTIRTTFDSPP